MFIYLLEIDVKLGRCLAKPFCFLDADSLVVRESQGRSQRSVGKYPCETTMPGR